MTVYDTVSLPYDLNLLLTQQAPIERDTAVLDKFGGETQAKREVVLTVRCRFYWWTGASARSPAREYADPQVTFFFTGGGIVVEPGIDVRNFDHVQQIETPEKELLIAGPFRVVAVKQWESHTDVALMRP